MAPLHPIILRSVTSVKDFLDKLIDIDHDSGKAENIEHNTKKGEGGSHCSAQRGDIINTEFTVKYLHI